VPRFVRQAPALRVTLAAVVLALTTAAPATAQPSPKVARATRIQRAPRIDGKLDDAGWARVPAIDDFVQRQPREGAADPRDGRSAILSC